MYCTRGRCEAEARTYNYPGRSTSYKWTCCGSQARQPEWHSSKSTSKSSSASPPITQQEQQQQSSNSYSSSGSREYCSIGRCAVDRNHLRVYEYDYGNKYKWTCCGSQSKQPECHSIKESIQPRAPTSYNIKSSPINNYTTTTSSTLSARLPEIPQSKPINNSHINNKQSSEYCTSGNCVVSEDSLLTYEYDYGKRYKWICCGSQARYPECHTTRSTTNIPSSPLSNNNARNNYPPFSVKVEKKVNPGKRARRTKAEKFEIYNSTKGVCYLCKKDLPPFESSRLWHIEHVIPFSLRNDLDIKGIC